MRRAIFCLLAAALAVLAVVAIASGRGSGTATLCAQGNAGELALAQGGKCGAGKRKIALAKRGPRGKAGTPGPNGAAGPAGADGAVPPLEPVTFLAPATDSCQTKPGSFCAISPVNYFYGNAGGGFARAGFFKDVNGFVHLQGLAGLTCVPNCSGKTTTWTTMFYLPSGYRPAQKHEYVIGSCEAENRSLLIKPNGAVSTTSAGCTTFDSLDGVNFYP